jgi:hypothetical protein
MNTVRSIAQVLYYLALIFGILYCFTAIYASLVLLFSGNGQPSWLPYIEKPNGSFQINYPFGSRPFLLGDNSRFFKTVLLLVTWGYAIFLILLSGVFDAFRKNKLFIPQSVRQLTRFYKLNLFIPVVILIFFILASWDTSEIIFITFLHAVVGIFAYFMSSIFKQGLLLQEEQDLTL